MKALRSTVGNFLRNLLVFFRCEISERQPCRACRSAAHFEPAQERATRVHRACENPFACERYKLGRGSPGPVSDAEYLNLVITDPQAIDPRTGKLLPILVNQIDRGGLSVLRDAATIAEFDVTFAEMKKSSDAKGNERYFHSVCRFLTFSVRLENQARHLGVYDTALPGRPHHADILAPPPASRRDQEARKRRIIDKIGPSLIAVADFRGGTFVKYARDGGG
jgi:hypothetical protein